MNIPLPTPKEMGHWDRLSIDSYGIPGEMLMENASREAFHVLKERVETLEGLHVVLFAGSGNNGGDAFALSRHLSDCGARCMVLHTRPQDQYTGETAFHLKLAKKVGVPLVYLPEYNLDFLTTPEVIVDGLLGTGFQGALRQDYLDWVTRINQFKDRALIMALDIPSGLSGLTGRADPTAVKADCTVTFGATKVGLFMPEAREFTGELHTRTIGIPKEVQESNPPQCFGLNQNILAHLPAIKPTGHKGNAGHVLILGGSFGLSGAPTLAGLGVLRSGGGLVTVGCPKGVSSEIKQGWPEIMTLALGPGRTWSAACFEDLKPQLAGFDTVVLGPGMGRNEGGTEFLQTFLQAEHPPTVIDADGLFHLAQARELWSLVGPETILTPHPGEMARLSGQSIPDIQNDRIEAARDLARHIGCTLVLKGAGTVIAGPEALTSLSPFACPSLAVGGSGDVLSGIIGSLVARGVNPYPAACLGVYWHGLAGMALEDESPHHGRLAREIAHILPQALEFPGTHV